MKLVVSSRYYSFKMVALNSIICVSYAFYLRYINMFLGMLCSKHRCLKTRWKQF